MTVGQHHQGYVVATAIFGECFRIVCDHFQSLFLSHEGCSNGCVMTLNDLTNHSPKMWTMGIKPVRLQIIITTVGPMKTDV